MEITSISWPLQQLTLGSSKYEHIVPHLLNVSFPRNVSDLEVVNNYLFPLMFPGFNVWKKVEHYSAMQDNFRKGHRIYISKTPRYFDLPERSTNEIFSQNPDIEPRRTITLGTTDKS